MDSNTSTVTVAEVRDAFILSLKDARGENVTSENLSKAFDYIIRKYGNKKAQYLNKAQEVQTELEGIVIDNANSNLFNLTSILTCTRS
jgi:thermostable 8-oxoguanine DNA glycosylase